ncbi:MAG TPA: adenosine kinase [Magnetospirillaceae bacterium]|nr:adenosine kinase [Magnetospirillaceae bacterium]
MQAAYDVAANGNAIVDILARVEEPLLAELGVEKGIMTLVDAERSEAIYNRLPPAVEVSGGSAANTAAGIASLGGKVGFIGKVKDDQLGAVFRHDLTSLGVHFPTAAGTEAATARCMIMVTPDAQRTMQTYLGACVELTPADVDEALIRGAQVTYLEGYLWDRPDAKEAFLKAAGLAHQAGRKVALSLSDPFCVERHRDSFLTLLANHVDLVFANEAEITALYQSDLDQAISAVRGHVELAAITRGEHGSTVVTRDGTVSVPAERTQRLVDTTGAGDLYAAGFLYAYTHGRDAGLCARTGSICAAEVISHMGPRPETNLARLVESTLSAV